QLCNTLKNAGTLAALKEGLFQKGTICVRVVCGLSAACAHVILRGAVVFPPFIKHLKQPIFAIAGAATFGFVTFLNPGTVFPAFECVMERRWSQRELNVRGR